MRARCSSSRQRALLRMTLCQQRSEGGAHLHLLPGPRHLRVCPSRGLRAPLHSREDKDGGRAAKMKMAVAMTNVAFAR